MQLCNFAPLTNHVKCWSIEMDARYRVVVDTVHIFKPLKNIFCTGCQNVYHPIDFELVDDGAFELYYVRL